MAGGRGAGILDGTARMNQCGGSVNGEGVSREGAKCWWGGVAGPRISRMDRDDFSDGRRRWVLGPRMARMDTDGLVGVGIWTGDAIELVVRSCGTTCHHGPGAREERFRP